MNLIFFSSLSIGGLARFTWEVSKRFLNEFENIYIFSAQQPHPMYITLSKKYPNIFILKDFVALKKVLNKEKKFIIHYNYSIFTLFNYVLKYKYMGIRKVNSIITLHGIPQPFLENKFKYRFMYSAELFSLKNFVKKVVKNIVAISRFVKINLEKNFKIRNIRVIYNGVDHTIFKPFKSIVYRNMLDWRDYFILLNVGRLHPIKRQIDIVKAVHILRKKYDVKLILVGKDGNYYHYLVNFIKKYKLKNNIRILDEKFDDKWLSSIYNLADLYIHATYNEMFGLSLLEAMACGLPIIANNTGAVKEVAGNSCLYYNFSDHIDLANKIKLLIENSRLKKMMAKNSLKRSFLFDWEKTIEEYKKVYFNFTDNET